MTQGRLKLVVAIHLVVTRHPPPHEDFHNDRAPSSPTTRPREWSCKKSLKLIRDTSTQTFGSNKARWFNYPSHMEIELIMSTKLWWMGGYLCASRWRSFFKRWGGLDNIHGALQVEAMTQGRRLASELTWGPMPNATLLGDARCPSEDTLSNSQDGEVQ
ncbi:uncharacterized protein LOC124667570 [Lolium rigidum]|uniref:uncharacterized protein LOC124667570 n=1 Tax=Lolium rigidum TaxID=89674 RepID=UPI001F5D5929|nr:uncharacterized protein LOC124667570 [Lolium rigidum]